MYVWAAGNNSEYHGKKFVVMTFGDPSNTTTFLDPDGQPIAVKTNTRDLGIQMSADLQFTIHTNNIIKKAQKMSGWALRTFRTRTNAYNLEVTG